MQIKQCSVVYYPFIIGSLTKIDKSDLKNGTLILPDSIGEVTDRALPMTLKPKKIILPSDEISIGNSLKRSNATFVLEKCETLNSLFSGVKSQKIILPDNLKIIEQKGFRNSRIGELEIPNCVEKCDELIFDGATIKHLIINKRLLNQINARFLSLIKGSMQLTIVDNDKIVDLTVTQLDKEEFKKLNLVKDAIDSYLSVLESKPKTKELEKLKKYLIEQRNNLIKSLNKKLNYQQNKMVLINSIINSNSDIKSNKTISNMPIISTDGYFLIKDKQKIKMLSLESVLKSRNLI